LVCAKSRGRNRRLTVEICGRDWRGTTMIPTIAFVAGMTPGCILGLKIGLFQMRLTVSACRSWPFKAQRTNMAHWRKSMRLNAVARRRWSGLFCPVAAMIPAMSDQSGFCASSRAFAQIWTTRRPGPVSHLDGRGARRSGTCLCSRTDRTPCGGAVCAHMRHSTAGHEHRAIGAK